MPSIAFHTLGCKLNFAESSDLLRRFVEKGFTETNFHNKADVYVINTCTVTQAAESKCRNAIRVAHKLNPKAIIAVIGCFSQVGSDKIAKIDGVNIILGNDNKHFLVDKVLNYQNSSIVENDVVDISHLRTFYPSFSFDDRTRGFLKVQDGCDYFCTYCEIPFARGRSRSCTVKEAVHNAQLLAKQNKKEIVLTGVNIGDFGIGTDETFFDLVKALDKIEDVKRYRISSIEPNLLTKEIIDYCRTSRAFMPHFHIPLQSGSNIVLKAMHRKYLREDFADKVNYIHSIWPECFIACDVMSGFNYETDEEFRSAYDFLESLPIAFIHVFTYSERPNTKASTLGGKIPIYVRRQRSEELQKLSERKKREFYKAHLKYKTTILWEENNKGGYMYGFSDNYLRCKTKFDKTKVNQITEQTLDMLAQNDDLFIIR